MLKDILSDGIFALFNKISYFGAKTLAIVLITRELGVDTGGSFIFLIGTLEILRVVSDFGVDIFVIKKYSDVENPIKLLKKVFFQKVSIGIFVSILFFVISYAFGYGRDIYIPISLSLFFALLFNLSNSYFQSQNLNKALSPSIALALVLTFLSYGVQFILKIPFTAWDYLLAEGFFVSAVTIHLFRKVGWKSIRAEGKITLKDVFVLYRHTVSIGLNAMVVIIYSRLDNIYIKNIVPEGLAAYGQIFRLVDPLVMVSSLFSTVAYAKFSRMDLRSYGNITKVYPFIYMIVGYITLSTVCYYAVLSFFGRYIILDNENNNIMILGFLLIAGIKCMNGALTSIIQSQGLYRFGLYIALICMFIAIPLMYILVQQYGTIGAIFTIASVELTSMILLAVSIGLLTKKKI
ncbi:O17/O44/O106 family O-antigen flippase [Enterobacter roggenkampii]|uniref:O17/O44/O106 family O-antigen flippase n=1 Tax=Enterobacter roggenkampii TaxID=1812935 RepID=UPI001C701C58|nr:O17/O44/O106 family O-antigen flippase [Enterobacter roggenkampii]MBW9464739.1 O17/O44/O106 family O-antigen flippase [Enterobacter roggenkampii]MCK7405324.1 O17/O44/O106 family O-antigen flippase [Enterobacter roggenkampii]